MPGVEVLGVLADDHEVHVVVARLEALDRAGGRRLAYRPSDLAQGHVDAAEAGADGRRDRALEGDLVAPDRLEHVVRERRPVLGHDAFAGVLDLPVEGDAGGVEDTAGGLRQLGTDAVAGDEGDSVGHGAHSSHAARDARSPRGHRPWSPARAPAWLGGDPRPGPPARGYDRTPPAAGPASPEVSPVA